MQCRLLAYIYDEDGIRSFWRWQHAIRPWDKFTGMDLAKARVEASFEFFEKMDVPFFCFHDVDIAPEGRYFKRNK